MPFQKILAFATGPIANAALGLLLLPLISWFFSTSDIAQITLMQTHASLMLIVLGLGLDQAYIREFHASQNQDSLFKNIILLPFCLLLVISPIALMSLPFLAQTTFIQSQSQLGLALWLFGTLLFGARYLSIILRMNERAWAFSFSQTLPKLVLLISVAMLSVMPSEKNVVQLAFAYVFAQAITVLWLSWQTRQTWLGAMRSPFQLAQCVQALRYGLPLAGGGLAYWGLVSVDKFLMRQYSNLDELGVYAVATSLSALALIVQSIFATIWSPTVFRWVEQGGDMTQVVKVFRWMSALILALLCLTLLASPMLTVVLPKPYASVQFIVLSSMCYPLFYTLTEVSGIGINVQKKTGLAAMVATIAMLVNILLCHYLIVLWGARGAAVATSISFWLFFVLKTEISSRLWLKLPRTITYGYTLPALIISNVYTLYGHRENYIVFALLGLGGLMYWVKQYGKQLLMFVRQR